MAFYSKNFSLGPQNQEDPAGKAAAAPHVEAPLVVGASTSIAPSGGAPPLVERIKLAQENMGLVQKLLAVSNRLIEYFSLCESCSLTTDPCYFINSGAGGAGGQQALGQLRATCSEGASVQAHSQEGYSYGEDKKISKDKKG